MQALAVTQPKSETMKEISNSSLKLQKCVLIPLEGPFMAELQATIQRKVKEVVPARSAFTLAASGTYLGFKLGPAGGREICTEATMKLQKRGKAVARGQQSGQAIAYQNNSRAFPVMAWHN